MIQLYFNGDSFVAGVELGDDILPEYPGLTPLGKSNFERRKLYPETEHWMANTYDPSHYLSQHRNNNLDAITELEFERAFPNKVQQLTNLPVTNHALGGSSMDRIVRTTIQDLHKLKKENPNDTIIAFIGTTAVDRTSIPNSKVNQKDMHNSDVDHICIAKTFSNTNDEYVQDMRKYKIMYETDYHSILQFYENIFKLKYFCEKNDIPLYFISTWSGLEQLEHSEDDYQDRPLMEAYKSLADFQYSLNMRDYIDSTANEICPSGHFGEPVHNKIAIDVVKIIERHK